MNPRDLLSLVLASLLRNKIRGSLTILGIIIGVAAVIVMISIGRGSQQVSEDLIRNMGTNLLMIHAGSTSKTGGGPLGLGTLPTLTEEDAEAIRLQLPQTVATASPIVRGSRAAIYQDANWLVDMVMGVNPYYLSINPWALERGRYFTEQEVKSQAKVCVLGKTVQDNLFPGGEDPLGKVVRIGRLPCEVIGILVRKGGGPRGDQDDTIHAPYTTVMHKILGRDRIHAIVASAVSESSVDLADSDITALLRQRHQLQPGEDNDFSIRRQEDWIQASAEHGQIITALLTLAAAISLLVGGIGISNIMLVSVTERTQEIGLRRSSGATRRNILFQFLLEAILMASSGGVLGIGLAVAALRVLQAFQVPTLLQAWAVLLAFGFSAVVGIAAGFMPALKAARLDIVEAIRYE